MIEHIRIDSMLADTKVFQLHVMNKKVILLDEILISESMYLVFTALINEYIF